MFLLPAVVEFQLELHNDLTLLLMTSERGEGRIYIQQAGVSQTDDQMLRQPVRELKSMEETDACLGRVIDRSNEWWSATSIDMQKEGLRLFL